MHAYDRDMCLWEMINSSVKPWSLHLVSMSDERPFFTPIAEPDGTGVSGLLAEAKASEVKYKDRCKMHVLASPEVGWTPRRIGRYLKRHPRTVQRILEQPETPTKS